MKKTLVATLALGMVAGATSLALADINGSAHDFGTSPGAGGSSPEGEICIPCHTPHNAYGPAGGPFTNTLVPLWNHLTTTTAPSPYTGVTDSGTTYDAGTQPVAGVSLACMSCHDGTLGAWEYYLPGGGTQTGGTLIGSALLGTDLSNDHPVSIIYDTALVTADTATAGGVVGLRNPTVAPASNYLFPQTGVTGGLVECGSCHDVHNQGDSTASFLLKLDNTDSALCLECHIK